MAFLTQFFEPTAKTLRITVDKSHITSIGEKLYAESIELLRELINNSYDADSTLVEVQISDDCITVKDNGSGMDEAGLQQYFTIGGSDKRQQSLSPIFKRLRIGEFGIGKFASLSAADMFSVLTQKNGDCLKVSFDKTLWESSNHWDIPIETAPSAFAEGHGSVVTLTRLHKVFAIDEVRRQLVNRLPLKAANFLVLINGEALSIRDIPGRKFEFNKNTMYGDLSGHIVFAATLDPGIEAGIDCKVKGITVKRQMFGLPSHVGRCKLIGEVNADWLPVLSARNDFVVDRPEYVQFERMVRLLLGEILKKVQHEQQQKDKRKSSEALKEAIHFLKRALKKNPDLCPKLGAYSGPNPVQSAEADSNSGGIQPASLNPFTEARKVIEKKLVESELSKVLKKETLTPKEQKQKAQVLATRSKASHVQKIKLGDQGFTFITDHFGSDAPESFTNDQVICINQDHPVYQRCEKDKDLLAWHYLRLIAQEIVMIDSPQLFARRAFELQSRLIRDAGD